MGNRWMEAWFLCKVAQRASLAHPDDGIPKAQTMSATQTPTDSRRSSREVSSSDEPLVDTSPVRVPAPGPAPTRSVTVSGARPPPPPKPASHSSISTNPFINRNKPHEPQHPPPPSRVRPSQSPLPPLPPRKPTVPPPPPPRHSSLASPNASGFPASATSPAFAFWQNHSGGTPTNPNVLIQQSLQAGRIAQSLKKAEERLEQERVMEVLKSSSSTPASGSSRTRTRSESPTKEMTMTPVGKPRSTSSFSGSGSSGTSGRPKSTATVTSKGPALPPRRRPSPPLSAASARSFEQVAQASIPLSARSRDGDSIMERICTPPPQHPDLVSPPQPPPTHPDRKPTRPPSALDLNSDDGSPSGRVYRSKSMHHPQPPLPPPRRRRPESVQFGTLSLRDRSPSPSFTERTSKSANTALSSPASIPNRGHGYGHGSMSRHLSLSMHSSRRPDAGAGTGPGTLGATPKEESPLANIRSTFVGLQPKLDAARYKAEAGLSRRGYVNYGRESVWHDEGEERLMSEPDSVTRENTGISIEESDDGGVGQDTGAEDGIGAGEKGRWNGAKKGGGSIASWDDSRRGRSATSGGELRSGRMKPWEVERDEMKWPAGEGWAPL
ncbi:hypothetical protein EIP86_008896 [Pleurotus ostreatoroseus]|nr:hypothetical protein EIP86_008896 [Pleurotus ostreatoroseus]